MEQKEKIIKASAEYFKLGWENLPVKLGINPKTGKKLPIFPKWENGKTVSWSDDTFTKESTLALIDRYNCNGLAIKTGKNSNLFVLDCDQPLDLAQQYLEENNINIPDDTPSVKTQSNGLQHYFQFHKDLENITSTGAKIFGVGSPVDIRGNKGLVFAPPSIVSGGGK